MAKTGVKVKALESYPDLYEAQIFYLEMYNLCGANTPTIMHYSNLVGLTNEETLEALKIINMIAIGVE